MHSNSALPSCVLNQDPSRKHPAWRTKPGHDISIVEISDAGCIFAIVIASLPIGKRSLIGRRLAGTLRFCRLDPPGKIVGEAGERSFKLFSRLPDRFAFGGEGL